MNSKYPSNAEARACRRDYPSHSKTLGPESAKLHMPGLTCYTERLTPNWITSEARVLVRTLSPHLETCIHWARYPTGRMTFSIKFKRNKYNRSSLDKLRLGVSWPGQSHPRYDWILLWRCWIQRPQARGLANEKARSKPPQYAGAGERRRGSIVSRHVEISLLPDTGSHKRALARLCSSLAITLRTNAWLC
ncbi:hypothetical protein RRG08_003669 [Elysia crispata]|uniref:Uncharacterized protein n=1 Tax=Elysia crispata TaxID=231223 RepID=A0AAE1E6D2_9GAST|nr:hypothetical protein RRG08_003669 [Elysia crispata]